VPLRSRSFAIATAALLLLHALAAAAQPPPKKQARRIEVNVTVSHALDKKGEIDPRGQELHSLLKPQIRYGGLRVLQEERLDLALDQTGTVELPNGRKFRVRPLNVGAEGVLLSVSVQGTLWTDMRVRNGHRVVIGAERFEDGKLVISIQPRF
jgi:hypothetical protein